MPIRTTEELLDAIGAKDALLPLDSTAHDKLEESTMRLLSQMPDREQCVLRMRFGIAGHSCSLPAVAREFGVTTLRIQQIENEALRRL